LLASLLPFTGPLVPVLACLILITTP